MYRNFLGKFKKIKTDKHTTTMRHEDGHIMSINHNALSSAVRKQIESLPLAEGGEISDDDAIAKKELYDKSNREAIEYGADPVEYPEDVQRKIASAKPKKAYADGGEVSDEEMPAAPEADMPMQAAPIQAPIPQMMAPQEPIPVNPAANMPMTPSQSPQMAPAAPGLMPQDTSPMPSAQPDMMHAYAQQQAGINQAADTQGAMGQAAAAIHEKAADQLMVTQKHLEEHQIQTYGEIQNAVNDLKNGHIDPNRLMDSRSTGQKVSTVIGLILGGMGSGLTGGPNPALQFLNQQIDRDIDAQKANMAKKQNLVHAYYQQLGDERAATDMAKATMLQASSEKLKEQAALSASPMAKANAMQASAQLEMQMAPLVQSVAMRKTLMQGQQENRDPANFVPFVVPKEHQKAAYDEISRAQDTRRMGDSIMQSFDSASKDNTVLKTGAGLLRTPASVYALHQSLQPTFKDLEGTVRQAAMDNTFKNITPAPGDTASTIATKRQALSEYLRSKASAPIAKSFGLDLDKFKSTDTTAEGRLSPQQEDLVRRARANPNDPRAAMILQKLGLTK